MAKRKRTALVKLNNLPMLQNLIRRDPPSYREEFLLQYRHYESQRDIFMAQPEGYEGETFAELVGFMAQVTICYPDITKNFPNDLGTLLLNGHSTLHPELREKLVQSLVLLRNKDVVSSEELLRTLFPILTVTKSKGLRGQIYTTIISEMRNANSKSKNHKLNKTIQTVLFGMVDMGKTDPLNTSGLWAVKIVRELWRRNIWDDTRTVEIMKEATLSTNPKVVIGGCKFFLGVDQEKEEIVEGGGSDEEEIDIGKLRYSAGINKTNKKKRMVEKAIEKVKRRERAKHKPHPLNFSALHLLRNPQGFVEDLFNQHLSKKSKLSLEQKLVVLQLVSRLVGLHKLELLPIYSYLLKYLTPRQRDVTQFLICAAQSSHDLVPPDLLEPIVRKIADEFVSDGVASEVATAGLNSIREICARAPLAMNSALLQDLTEYKGSNDKGVMMAARSLIVLYREIAPEMLRRKDRGKVAQMGMKKHETLRFGEEKDGVIDGLELLEAWKEEQKLKKLAEKGKIRESNPKVDEEAEGKKEAADDYDQDDGGKGEEAEEEEGWSGWEVESESDSDEEGWINVSSDEEQIEISDSEDEKPKKKSRLAEATETKEQGEGGRDLEEGGNRVQNQPGENPFEGQKPEEAAKSQLPKSSHLATTWILTPADFSKLQELRAQAELNKALGRRTTSSSTSHSVLANEQSVSLDAIQAGNLKRGKSTREERIASAMEGRKGREKFGSSKGKRLEEKPHSTTNKDKRKKKNFLMMLGQAKRKSKGSLIERQKVLRKHMERLKKRKHK